MDDKPAVHGQDETTRTTLFQTVKSGHNLPFPERKKAAYLNWHKLLSMTNGKHCPLMRLSLLVISLISHIPEYLRPAVMPLLVQAAVFLAICSLL
jgi:hypothetical protein